MSSSQVIAMIIQAHSSTCCEETIGSKKVGLSAVSFKGTIPYQQIQAQNVSFTDNIDVNYVLIPLLTD